MSDITARNLGYFIITSVVDATRVTNPDWRAPTTNDYANVYIGDDLYAHAEIVNVCQVDHIEKCRAYGGLMQHSSVPRTCAKLRGHTDSHAYELEEVKVSSDE